jgi:hypothetical protein
LNSIRGKIVLGIGEYVGPMLMFMVALAHERLSPAAGSSMSDEEMSEIVQETRIDLSVWLR